MAAKLFTTFAQGEGTDIRGPFLDREGALTFVCQSSGDMLSCDPDRSMVHVGNTGGQPMDAAIDADGVMHVADLAHGAILVMNPDGKYRSLVAAYEGAPLLGPTSLSFDDRRNLYFADAGGLGETGLHNPTGSVYTIRNDDNAGPLLRPVARACLAYPSGVAASGDGRIVYVCEMAQNRIIRYTELPVGCYQGTVFARFTGGMGPSAMVVNAKGEIYVAHYDVAASGARPRVSVLSPTGELQGEIEMPNGCGPEITGLSFNAPQDTLYITEASSSSVYEYHCA